MTRRALKGSLASAKLSPLAECCAVVENGAMRPVNDISKPVSSKKKLGGTAMKTIRSMMVLSGICLAFFALVATGAHAQTLDSTSFAGTFTLPLETHWGAVTLPAGEYNLSYGLLFRSGTHLVTVAGEAKGTLRGMILPAGRGDVSAAGNVLNCIRVDDRLYVRALEMPAIGESLHFKIPHGVEVESKVIAGHQNQKGNNQIALVSIGIERVPVK